jgi:hypothetical protein
MGGDSLFFARLPTLAMLLASAALAASWVGRRAGDRAAVVTALLVLGSPLALRFGHLAMMDVPLGFVCLALARVGEAWRGGLRLPPPVPLHGGPPRRRAELERSGPRSAPAGLADAGRRPQWSARAVEAPHSGLRARGASSAAGGWCSVGASMANGSSRRSGVPKTQASSRHRGASPTCFCWRLAWCSRASPFGVWPKTMFHNQAAPLWARAFPPLVLAFYALPSVTFLQYAIVVAPAVAITVGTSAPRLRLRWLWVFAGTVGTGLLVLSFWVQFLHIPTTASCASYQFEGQDKGYFSLELHAPVRSGQGRVPPTEGALRPDRPLAQRATPHSRAARAPLERRTSAPPAHG